MFRPRFEALEDRSLLTTFFAATAADLIADVNAANKAHGLNTIVLTAPTTSPYVLTAVNNNTDGPTVLPNIKRGDYLTIVTQNGNDPGYGDIIDAAGHSRLFDVTKGASLTLENVTLQGGVAVGSGVPAEGGAILNRGTLDLSEVMIQNNAAVGSGRYRDAAGGGIWSNGSLTVEDSVIQGNSAVGEFTGGPGGNAFGGGIYIAGGTANITGTTFGAYVYLDASGTYQVAGWGNTTQGALGGGSGYGGAVYVAGGTVTMSADDLDARAAAFGYTANVAVGGDTLNGNGPHGNGYGGGLYVAGGTVTLTNDIVNSNIAGDFEDFTGLVHGYGGGIFIASGATVYLDLFTLTDTYGNMDSSSGQNGNGSTANIDGAYVLLP